MIRWIAFALALLASPVWAQTYTNQAAIVGAGAGVVGFNVVGPCNGQVLGWVAGVAQCVNGSGSTGVTSVALALPASTYSISGSPVTTTGTLTGSFINQTANTFFAGPGSGGAATPGWRALVNADIPVPTTSALGGIKALSPVSHNWINQIDNSGTPQVTQPAFTDISGAIVPAQCPTPTTSAIGCVQAINQVTSNWINSINSSGVPQLSQPNFNDLLGAWGIAQTPSFIANSVLANATGSPAQPTNISLSGLIDAVFGSAQGDVLYRGASGWTVLTPGTNGQVLQTGGASANVSWATVSGTGTVTSVTCNGGLSGGTFTTSGTCALSPVADGTVLSNISGGNAASSANSLSSVLDHDIASTQGEIIFRGGSTWGGLMPGTSGQSLITGGGSANPSWGTPVLRSYLAGLTLSNDGVSPTTVIDIAAGQAADSTNAVMITVGAFTKSTGGAWASGSGSNGMGNGLTISASTWYTVCLANNAGTPDYWFDTSVSCANKPTGITDAKFRRVGSFKTDGSSHIIAFKQLGDDFLWTTPVLDVNTTVGTVQTLETLSVPAGVQVQANFIAGMTKSSASPIVLFSAPDATGSTTANSPTGNLTHIVQATSADDTKPISLRTNTSSQINAVANTSSVTIQLVTTGWVDRRGRDN